ncbi:unnamed protein product [Sphagnum balticum]
MRAFAFGRGGGAAVKDPPVEEREVGAADESSHRLSVGRSVPLSLLRLDTWNRRHSKRRVKRGPTTGRRRSVAG